MRGLRSIHDQPLASSLRTATAWAAPYIGLPFKPLGRDWEGCDCWGLFRLVYLEQFGIELPRYDEGYAGTDRADFADIKRLITGALSGGQQWVEIPAGEERVGDGIALLINRKPFHVGLVVGGKRALVIEEGIEACTEEYVAMKWRNRVGGFYRWAGAL